MGIGARMALAAGLGLSCISGHATSYMTKEAVAAYEECLTRWKDVDGIWEGQLLTPGADIGGPYDKRIYVRLVFSRTGTTLLVKERLQSPWKRVGDDPKPADKKTGLVLNVQGNDAKDPLGHQIFIERLRESSAKVIYSRGLINPKPGETVSMDDMKAGLVVREGSPVPTGRAAEVWECVPK